MQGRGWDDSTMGPLIGRTGRVEAVYRKGATVLMRFSPPEPPLGHSIYMCMRVYICECVYI